MTTISIKQEPSEYVADIDRTVSAGVLRFRFYWRPVQTDLERLDKIQDVLYEQREKIDQTLELVEKWLIALEADNV